MHLLVIPLADKFVECEMKQGEVIWQLGFQYQSLPDHEKELFLKSHGVH